jgi:glutathione S-transferase
MDVGTCIKSEDAHHKNSKVSSASIAIFESSKKEKEKKITQAIILANEKYPKMVLEVHCDPCTVNSHKVLAALECMGVEYRLNRMNYFEGDHKKDAYKSISPSATIPAAIDGDLHIFESNAIMAYAADKYGKTSFYPTDLKTRAKVNCWLLWEAATWFGVTYKYLIEYAVKSAMKAEPDMEVVKEAEPEFLKCAKMLDDQLSQTKFLVGNEPTIADFAVASGIHANVKQGLPWDNFPHLKKWMKEGVEPLPGWKKTQEAVDKAFNIQTYQNGTVNGHSGQSSVETTLNYTKDLDPRLTELYFYETDAAKDIHLPGDDPQRVQIHDGWSKAKEFSVDKHGFELSGFQTSFNKWEDEDAVRDHFYPEIVDFLKRTVGAKRVLVFDHTIRTKANDQKKLTQETNTSQRAPVMLVHCDYTAESGPVRVKQLLPDEADDLLSRRVAFINIWKPVRSVVEERPLTMCDVTSALRQDFFKLHLRYRDRNGENYVMRYSDKHRWWYFPKMTPDQVILLKTYDSDASRAQFVGHSAFEDPTSPPDAKTRESVEIRTIAFF